MKTLGYYNGSFGPLEEMTVPMNDRACYFGDGVYEATLCANRVIFALDEHIDRIYRSAAMIEMPVPMEKEAMKQTLIQMVQKMDDPDLLVYWQLTRGTAPRAHTYPQVGNANLWITLRPAVLPDIREPRQLITMEDTRFLHCNIKTLNLLLNVMAAQKAQQAGCYETVWHRENRVTECSHSNVHILKNGALKTAPCDNLILPGIARAHLLQMCRTHGIGVEESPFTLEELFEADEVLVTSSTVLCLVADQIDGRPVGRKAPQTVELLQSALLEEFRLSAAGR